MARSSILGPVSPVVKSALSNFSLRPICYAAFAGGAAHVKELAGAAYALNSSADVLGCVGTSAGSLVSTALAFDTPEDTMRETLLDFLQHNMVLDFSFLAWKRYGLCRWEIVRDVIEEVWGSDTCLGDAKKPLAVVVSDVYARQPVVFSSWNTPKVKLVECLPASCAIPFLAAAQMIPSAGTGNRLYCDGGTADNFAIDVFADKPERTIGIRLQGQSTGEIVPVRSLSQYIAAVLGLLMWESPDIAGRKDDRVVTLKVKGSGFDFNQKPSDITDGILSGQQQMTAAIASGILTK